MRSDEAMQGADQVDLKKAKTRILGRLGRITRSLANNNSGNLAIMTSVLLPALILAVGVAVDYSSTYQSNSKLQEAADSSALASAKEMVLPNANESTIQAVATNYVNAKLGTSAGYYVSAPTIEAVPNREDSTVKVSITAVKRNAFGGFLQPETSTLTVSATARSLGGGKICVVVLEPKASAAIDMRNSSNLKALDCMVQSNSIDKAGIRLRNGAHLVADKICSAGGIKYRNGTTSIRPITDCPVIDDPLAYKMPPPVGGCDYKKMVITGKDVVTLDPGVYCGGLKVKKFAQVNLRPGIYVMKNGPLLVTDEAVFTGKNVGFYFLGNKSEATFRKATVIELTAPKDGPMAGLLMFSDRGNKSKQTFKITSEFARTLLGTIYLPNANLIIDSSGIIADKSAYTVIVTRRFQTEGSPEIIINSNYDSTDIPVPDGVGPGVTEIVLIK